MPVERERISVVKMKELLVYLGTSFIVVRYQKSLCYVFDTSLTSQLLSSKCCSSTHFIHQSLGKSRCETSMLPRAWDMKGEAVEAGGEFLLSRLLELK